MKFINKIYLLSQLFEVLCQTPIDDQKLLMLQQYIELLRSRILSYEVLCDIYEKQK